MKKIYCVTAKEIYDVCYRIEAGCEEEAALLVAGGAGVEIFREFNHMMNTDTWDVDVDKD